MKISGKRWRTAVILRHEIQTRNTRMPNWFFNIPLDKELDELNGKGERQESNHGDQNDRHERVIVERVGHVGQLEDQM